MTDRKILTITPAAPDYLPPLRLSMSHVMAGPNWKTGQNPEQLNLPFGEFSIRAVVPTVQNWDHKARINVVYEAFRTSVPRGLTSVDIPKTLLIGDTHHGTHPIAGLLNYTVQEICSDYLMINTPHHAHWLIAAGVRTVGWWPSPDSHQAPFGDARFSPYGDTIVFVGQTGQWHPRRNESLRVLRQSGYALRHARTPARIASRLYNESALSLNLTLNGDTNCRNWEVLSAGGCLLADRLQPQSGLAALFSEGEHFVAFDGDQDLCEVAGRLLRDPKRREQLSRQGYAEYWGKHSSARRVEEYWAHVDGLSDVLVRNLDYEKRAVAARSAPPVSMPVLLERVWVYEYLQEQVRVREGVRVLYLAGVEPLTVADSADLSRLHRAYTARPDQNPRAWQVLQSLGVSDQVTPTHVQAAMAEHWDLVVVGVDELTDPDVVNALMRTDADCLAVAGNGSPIPPSRPFVLSQFGWTPDSEWPSLYRRAVVGSHDLTTRQLGDGAATAARSQPAEGVNGTSIGVETTVQEPLVGAHSTITDFDWEAVSQFLPSPMNGLLSTGIISSLRIGSPVDGEGRAIPGFVHGATDFLEPLLDPSWRAHLWGNGTDFGWWQARVGHVTATLDAKAFVMPHVEGLENSEDRICVTEPESATYSMIHGAGGPIQVAVIGGEVPEECAKTVIQRLSVDGVVVVENSDRDACTSTVQILGEAGFLRIDFWGILPQYVFRGCTSVFFKNQEYLVSHVPPNLHRSSVGASFAQLTNQ